VEKRVSVHLEKSSRKSDIPPPSPSLSPTTSSIATSFDVSAATGLVPLLILVAVNVLMSSVRAAQRWRGLCLEAEEMASVSARVERVAGTRTRGRAV